MKTVVKLLFLVFLASCSDKISSTSSLGKDFIMPEKVLEYQKRPRIGHKAIFKITHENIDLSDYTILIQGSNSDYDYYYYGPYQKNITFYLPEVHDNYFTNLTFRIINQKTDSMYDFTSDLRYAIFETNNKPIKVKLLSKWQDYHGLEINYKLTGCPNDL